MGIYSVNKQQAASTLLKYESKTDIILNDDCLKMFACFIPHLQTAALDLKIQADALNIMSKR